MTAGTIFTLSKMITLMTALCLYFSREAIGEKLIESKDPSYLAAVYEHRVVLNPEPHLELSRHAALEHMQKNLDVYDEQAALASERGAQIIVFPEDGLQGFNFSRSSISGYLETIPDPQRESWNPCTEPNRYTNTEVLQRLSCMARRYRLYLVANMGDVQPCPLILDSSTCPPDRHRQFNTNVVFRSDGLLIARYHKHNLYFESAFDQPPSLEVITFDTPFAGQFGVLTCFDILFHNPTVALLKRGVRQLVYPTAWMNQLPLLAAVQFQRALSMGAEVSVLAANIRSDPLGMTGSGIFSPGSALFHHARSGEPEEGRLLVGRVPVMDPIWLKRKRMMEGIQVGKELQKEVESDSWSSKPSESGYCLAEDGCKETPATPHSNPSPSSSPARSITFVASMMYDPFAFVLLEGLEGKLTVCDGPLCCHLQFKRSPQGENAELYALGAFAGTHTVNGRYALQVCALVRCAGSEANSCGQEVEEAESKVDFLLEGKFGTRHVYPSVLTSGLVLEQPDQVERTADGGVFRMSHSAKSGGLLTACLYGRLYDQDNV